MPGCAYSEVSKERKALERGIAMYRNRYDDNCEYDDYDSYRGFDEPKAGQDCGCRCDRDFDDNRSAEDEQGFAQEYYNCNSDGGSACDCGCDCNRHARIRVSDLPVPWVQEVQGVRRDQEVCRVLREEKACRAYVVLREIPAHRE